MVLPLLNFPEFLLHQARVDTDTPVNVLNVSVCLDNFSISKHSHFMPLLDINSRDMTGNEGRQREMEPMSQIRRKLGTLQLMLGPLTLKKSGR